MSVKIAGIEFDNNIYDRDADILYLHVGEPSTAVDWDATAEGDHTRYGPDGSLVGITILNARWRLERDGKLEFTFPEQRVQATDLGDGFEHCFEEYVPDMVKIPGRVELEGVSFDDIEYDRRGDTLYLRAAGAPVTHAHSAEFNPLDFDADGRLVSVIIGEARKLLEREGKIVVTLPDGRKLELPNLAPTLAAA